MGAILGAIKRISGLMGPTGPPLAPPPPLGSLGLPRAPRAPWGGGAAACGGGKRQALINPATFLIFPKIDFLNELLGLGPVLLIFDHFGGCLVSSAPPVCGRSGVLNTWIL